MKCDEFLPIAGAERPQKVDLAAMQQMAEEEDILLPSEFNGYVDRKTDQDEDDDILICPNL